MRGLGLLSPEIFLSACALGLLLGDTRALRRPLRRLAGVLPHLAVLACAGAMGLVCLSASVPEELRGAGGLWAVDPMAVFFKILVLGACILVLWLSLDYRSKTPHGHPGSYGALVMLCAVGMMLLVGATDLLLALLAFELVSVSSFILAGFESRDPKSSEGAIKYFLIGAFSTGVMLYGISFYYGATGTTSLAAAQAAARTHAPLVLLAALFWIVGLGFKASLVPFHFWVPDAYEGAPTPITTFLSIAPKLAALAFLVRVFGHMLPHGVLGLGGLFALLAMLTMTFGNLVAMFQDNVKRLLAYSSIAQAGYILIGLATGDALGREGLLLYCLAYLLMNAGAFAVAIAVGNEDGYELSAYDGLACRSLGLALLMTLFLLSLAGIPPLAGFVGKFYLFAAAVGGGFWLLAVVAVLNSVVSVYYYMRIVVHMFFKEPVRPQAPALGLYLCSSLALAAAGVLLLGIYPEPFVAAVKSSAVLLTIAP
ncbi:MAG: NADH-quinone oxidoreductase subunit N [Elusimicrobiota bacterium]